jgi:hypothetical protein
MRSVLMTFWQENGKRARWCGRRAVSILPSSSANHLVTLLRPRLSHAAATAEADDRQ